jgi:chorismate mutase
MTRTSAWLHERWPDVPRIALTATATEATHAEIAQRLDLRPSERARHFVASFDRPNIQYRIAPKDDPRRQLLDLGFSDTFRRFEQTDRIRDKIDELDRRLIETLAERHKTVRDLFSNKLDEAKKIRDTDREKELFRRIREIATEAGIDPYFAEKLFQDIITQSVRYQTYSLVDHQNENGETQVVKVSYQGVSGAFSNQAALRHFSDRYNEVECIGFKTFEQAGEAVEQKKVDYAILPIENTTAGSINDTYDLLAK